MGIKPYRWIFLVTLVLCYTLPQLAHAAGVRCRTADDISKHEGLMWLDGTAVGQSRLISCIDEAWRYFEEEEQTKSTEFVNLASSNLVAALKFNPISFIEVMDQHSWLLDRWLRDIEFDIFTWREDPPCGFSAQIENIRSTLKLANKSAGKSASFRKIRDRFRGVECNQIN